MPVNIEKLKAQIEEFVTVDAEDWNCYIVCGLVALLELQDSDQLVFTTRHVEVPVYMPDHTELLVYYSDDGKHDRYVPVCTNESVASHVCFVCRVQHKEVSEPFKKEPVPDDHPSFTVYQYHDDNPDEVTVYEGEEGLTRKESNDIVNRHIAQNRGYYSPIKLFVQAKGMFNND